MALKERNTYGDLATHFGVSVDTICRWLKVWSKKLRLRVKRPSCRLHYMIRSEVERWEKAMDAYWDDDLEADRLRKRGQAKSRRDHSSKSRRNL